MSEKEVIVVVSRVKETIAKADMNTSSDFPEALSDSVHAIVKQAIERAKANGRKTVRPEDL